MIQAIQYDPFGKPLWTDNPALHIPLGFAGGLEDPDTGLVRFGWRDYDPDTGRWTVLDPIGDAGGDDDWYGYCLDDPVNGVDPLGLFLFGGAGLASLALAGAGTGIAGLMADGLGALAGKNKSDPFKATKGGIKGVGLSSVVVGPTAVARAVPLAAANPTLLTQGSQALKRYGNKAKEIVKPVTDKVLPHGDKIDKAARVVNDVVNDSSLPETFEGHVINAAKHYGDKAIRKIQKSKKAPKNEKSNKTSPSTDWWGR